MHRSPQLRAFSEFVDASFGCFDLVFAIGPLLAAAQECIAVLPVSPCRELAGFRTLPI